MRSSERSEVIGLEREEKKRKEEKKRREEKKRKEKKLEV